MRPLASVSEVTLKMRYCNSRYSSALQLAAISKKKRKSKSGRRSNHAFLGYSSSIRVIAPVYLEKNHSNATVIARNEGIIDTFGNFHFGIRYLNILTKVRLLNRLQACGGSGQKRSGFI